MAQPTPREKLSGEIVLMIKEESFTKLITEISENEL